MRIWPGSPRPLGATWDGEGVNFALFSQNATKVEVCLFDTPDAPTESDRVAFTERTNDIWHVYLPDVRPGQLYGYRVDGPYEPRRGHRFNANKLLIDPYAKAISGKIAWHDTLFGYRVGDPAEDMSMSSDDSAPHLPRCVVVDSTFPWDGDRRPRIPWSRTVIYECHVKGMTAMHPLVPERLRGTYLGLAQDAVIDHLLALGVTSVELLPVHHFAAERDLVERGLTNYWGYNTLGFFAPDPRYATAARGGQVAEFKSMVKALHRVGLEVILDVVYNHTAEGNHLGATLSFRGIDNASYYRLSPVDARYYVDYTGCGNTPNVTHPRVLQLVLDSLRYWISEMHVDGFRFDLAPALARAPEEFDRFSRFFATIQQDPIVSSAKLIAEPWDLGPDGYQLGAFPHEWAEWNGRYRDTVRRFWRGEEGRIGPLASRFSGSSDIFQPAGRGPYASVNFLTCHDGFTLRDLVSYENKHNEANGESNRDGTDANYSRNCGVEGETESVNVVRMRERMVRNLFASLAFSQGVPMISHGDELGRTQKGNNNAYCQDNPLAWIDWDLDQRSRDLLEFARTVFRIRRSNPVFRRRRYFAGDPVSVEGAKDVSWVRPDGSEMEEADWGEPANRVLGMLIHGEASDELDERGRPNRGETLLLLMNGGRRAKLFQLPTMPGPGQWHEMLNTTHPTRRRVTRTAINLVASSLLLLRYEEAR